MFRRLLVVLVLLGTVACGAPEPTLVAAPPMQLPTPTLSAVQLADTSGAPDATMVNDGPGDGAFFDATPTLVPTADVPTIGVAYSGNLRAAPSKATGTVVDQVYTGETVRLIGISSDSKWLRAENHRGIEGWVHVSLLKAIDASVLAELPISDVIAIVTDTPVTPTTDAPVVEIAPPIVPTSDQLLVLPPRSSSPSYSGGGSVCSDGWVSPSGGRGRCSHHGGVAGSRRRKRP